MSGTVYVVQELNGMIAGIYDNEPQAIDLAKRIATKGAAGGLFRNAVFFVNAYRMNGDVQGYREIWSTLQME